MGHLASMVVFSFFVSLVFALLSKDTQAEQMRYFFKTFLMFVGLSILAAWVMYFLPW